MNKHNSSIFNFNHDIIRVFIKLFALFCLSNLIFWVIILPQYSKGYNAALLDKMERLQAVDSPKLILVGNSNLAFGIKSEMLEKDLPYQIVNLGLHGGLGNIFHEEMIRGNINQGDLVVFCYNSFCDDDSIGYELAWTTIENHFELWKILRMKDIYGMYRAFPVYLKKAITLWADDKGNQEAESVYTRSAFNEYGDIAFERPATIDSLVNIDDVQFPLINNECIDRLNLLNKYIIEQGAIMVIAGYPILDDGSGSSEDKYMEFQNELEELVDCPVISDYIDYFFDRSYFYNTCLHLTDKGAARRTQQLINDINTWMEQENIH